MSLKLNTMTLDQGSCEALEAALVAADSLSTCTISGNSSSSMRKALDFARALNVLSKLKVVRHTR